MIIPLLKCPQISTDLINKYLSISNSQRKYSNFGFCEKELRKRFSKILEFPFEKITLGSSATLLLNICCNLFSEEIKNKNGNFYFPAFSFFSTFSIASSLNNKIIFYDIKNEIFLPDNLTQINENDLLFLNVPFGSSKKLESMLEYARNLPCRVIIDAAACLPGIIYKNIKFNNFPSNLILVLSLHATKLISSGEGGACLFGSKIPNHIRQLTNFGIIEGRRQRWTNSTNAKMSEFNAAAGLSSLDMAEFNIRKISSAKKRVIELCNNNGLNLFDDGCDPTLTLNIWSDNNKSLIDKLTKNNYEYRRWWSLVNNLENRKFKNSFKYYESIIGIPFDWEGIDLYFEKMCKEIS